MFNLGQILSASELIRNFKEVSKYLNEYPQALLVIQKSKAHLVLVNAEIFEDLLNNKLQKDGFSPELSGVKDILEIKKMI